MCLLIGSILFLISSYLIYLCKNAKVIKVGKISKYIENEFNL